MRNYEQMEELQDLLDEARALGQPAEEAAARARVLLEPAEAGVEVDLGARCVWLDGQRCELTAREWAVLESLTLRAGRIVAKDDLERLVMGSESELASNALEVHVSSLRRKLGRDLIETVRGLGYRVKAPP